MEVLITANGKLIVVGEAAVWPPVLVRMLPSMPDDFGVAGHSLNLNEVGQFNTNCEAVVCDGPNLFSVKHKQEIWEKIQHLLTALDRRGSDIAFHHARQ